MTGGHSLKRLLAALLLTAASLCLAFAAGVTATVLTYRHVPEWPSSASAQCSGMEWSAIEDQLIFGSYEFPRACDPLPMFLRGATTSARNA